MRGGTWAWPLPRVERDGGKLVFKGGAIYEPASQPCVWRRIVDLATITNIEPWFLALKRYGPLIDTTFSTRDETTEKELWERTIAHLGEVAASWQEASEGSGLWQVPLAIPVELSPGYRRARTELARVVHDGVRFDTDGLALTPAPVTLDAYLWLSAAEALRDRHRFKRCERCGNWFRVQRTDAQFCSAVCRNFREGR